MNHRLSFRVLATAGALLAVSFTADTMAQSARALDARSQQVIDHWTPDRREAAVPRDLFIDERGLGYMRGANGGLEPYGHDVAAQAGPTGGSDTTAPVIGTRTPAAGATVGAAVSFSAVVTDTGGTGVRSVSMSVRKGSGTPQSFAMTLGTNNTWSASLSGFTDGGWSWTVTAKDGAKPANTTTSPSLAFTVDTSGGGGGGGGGGSGDTITNAQWTNGGVVQNAVGRIYFEMPANARRTKWNGYVCSGTVVTDGTGNGRSIILTASHCVFDDANKAFARNVMFIPNQAGGGSTTDRNCDNDPIGCWVPKFGVVDVNWTSRTFPDNVAWDYAFYVVDDNALNSGHQGAGSNTPLDAAVVPTMDISFNPVNTDTTIAGSLSYAIGYSYSEDPKLMYCAERMKSFDNADYMLATCGLSGGSSGGPWSQTFNTSTGNGPIISVNSWGYTNQPGMAGPKLVGTSATCVFANAQSQPFTAVQAGDGNAGFKVCTPQ